MTHFKAFRGGIRADFSAEERVFLGDVLPMLAGIGAPGTDPAADRFRVPVYLDDPDAGHVDDRYQLAVGSARSVRNHPGIVDHHGCLGSLVLIVRQGVAAENDPVCGDFPSLAVAIVILQRLGARSICTRAIPACVNFLRMWSRRRISSCRKSA